MEIKSWDEFKSTGLLFFINQVLFAFGWHIVLEYEDGQVLTLLESKQEGLVKSTKK